MKDYCPKCENYSLVHNGNSILFSENYYCLECDKIFVKDWNKNNMVMGLKELSKDWFKKNFNSDRFDDIRQMSLIKKAREKVTKEQLQELGLLNSQPKELQNHK